MGDCTIMENPANCSGLDDPNCPKKIEQGPHYSCPLYECREVRVFSFIHK